LIGPGGALFLAMVPGCTDKDLVPVDTDTGPHPELPCPAVVEGGEPGEIYNHQVVGASSTDGWEFVSQEGTLLEHASVPDGLAWPDGRVWIYFVNGQPGQHGIFIAERQDDGTFLTVDCVRIDGEFQGNAVDPDVQMLPDGRVLLHFFKGSFVEPFPTDPSSIFSAVSGDGVHFEVRDNVWQSGEGVTDPSVVQTGSGDWLMALWDMDLARLARSADGVSYVATGLEFQGGTAELSRFEDGSIRLYQAGVGGLDVWESWDDGESFAMHGPTGLPRADASLVHESGGGQTIFHYAPDLPTPP
jgi:hypothetical protein